MTIRKKEHTTEAVLERLVINQWVGLGLKRFHSYVGASPTSLQAMS